jgi:dihydrofolate synthase / folylpolyglutamate synthase
MNYEEALNYIHSTYQFGSKLGLENIKMLLNYLGNPHEQLKVIHVAGTNGKGSVCSFIHSILVSAGYKTGLYTSPFLEEFTERIKINGENISKKQLAEITKIIKEKVEEMVSKGYNHPTEFEIVTAIAFYHYAEEKIDFLVLEVGLGGRLDATNVIDHPMVSVITPINYDHVQYLGDSLEKIAYEKAGIIKNNNYVVTCSQEKEVTMVFQNVSLQRNASLVVIESTDLEIHYSHIDQQEFSITILGKKYKNIKIGMAGLYQIDNCVLAIGAIEILRRDRKVKVKDQAVMDGAYNTKWAGRFEILDKNPLVIIDGAHNPHGAQSLKKSILHLLKEYKITYVTGMLKDKDAKGVLEQLVPLMDKVIVTKPNNPRAMEVDEIGKMVREIISPKKELYSCNTIEAAVEKAFKITPMGEAIIFAGSFYLIGKVRKLLK